MESEPIYQLVTTYYEQYESDDVIGTLYTCPLCGKQVDVDYEREYDKEIDFEIDYNE